METLHSFDVTEHDIRHGIPEDEGCCAVALAANREIDAVCSVGWGGELKKKDWGDSRPFIIIDDKVFPIRMAKESAKTSNPDHDLFQWLYDFDRCVDGRRITSDKPMEPIVVEVYDDQVLTEPS